MRVIGIDPGSRFTGYGIVEEDRGRLVHIDCGVIVPPPKAGPAARLFFIQDELERVIRLNEPDQAAIEDVFYANNWRSALKLGQARGAALAALGRCALNVSEYPPAKVKQCVVGHGRADKVQVAEMVRILLGLPERAEENASDALAVAISHLQAGGIDARLKELAK